MSSPAAASEGAAAPAQEKLPMGTEHGWTHRKDHTAMRQKSAAAFTKYYRDVQAIVPADQWDSLVDTLRTPLSTTFWINDTDPLAASVAEYCATLPSMLKPIAWYPLPGMAWELHVDKKTFRKSEELAPLRQFLIRQTAMGLTSRQEAVSMIPPFLLDLKATDRCLDMCASPGSKTAQLLAILGRAKRQADCGPGTLPFDYLSPGIVVANEKDEKRANMLVYQVRRLRQLFPFAAFVNHDARFMPDLTDAEGNVVKYDKILCDVVCSGDGTVRKAPNLLISWRAHEALSLQRIQIGIALRGCHLLRVGGRIVYSTCSINPIENEAVVHQLIVRTKGAMKLVDARGLLPSLRSNAGFKTWKVMTPKGEIVTKPGEQNMHEACFPPSAEDAEAMRLDLCMRFLPEHCDGGCFFIAVLEKVAEYEQDELPPPPPKKNTRKEGAEGEATTEGEQRKERYVPRYLPAFDEAKSFLSEFYGVNNFPTENLCSRAQQGHDTLSKTLGSSCSFVSSDVRNFIARQGKLVVVAAGLRAMAVETLTKGWRITHEASQLMQRFVAGAGRVVPAVPQDVAQLISEDSDANGISIDKIGRDDFREAIRALPIGGCFLFVAGPQAAQPLVPVAAMRARSRLQLQVDKDDLDDLRCRLDIGQPKAVTNLTE